jgi:hypothetical protein
MGYRVNVAAIAQSMKEIDLTIRVHPELTGDLLQLKAALNNLSMQDFQNTMSYQYHQLKRNRPAEQAFRTAGRLAGVGILGVATLFTGAIAAKNLWDNPSDVRSLTSPLLYGAGLYYLINPNFLQPGMQKHMESVGSIVNNPDFVRLSNNYHIEGPAWAAIIRKMHTSQGTEFARKVKTARYDPEALRNALDTMAPADPSDPTNASMGLEHLVMNGQDFDAFVKLISRASGSDEIKFVAAYAENGSWRHAMQYGPPPRMAPQGVGRG